MTKIMLLWMLIAGGLDIASTEYAFARVPAESIRELQPSKPVAYAFNVAAPLIFYGILRNRPGKLATWIPRVYIGVKSGIAARNFYVAATFHW